MASSFYSNTQHIDFASVLAMNDPGMVSMFHALIASGLEGFLGCTAVVYETALIDFFENASVRDGIAKERWADVCLEVVAFCSSRRLLPVGSVTFCRGLPVGETDFRVAPRHSPVFAEFLSFVQTAFRSAQISPNTVSVAPSVQLSLDQRQSSPNSADSSSSLHFDTTDLDATASSLPSVSIDFSAALADFQVILSEQINESQSGISSRLHKIEHGIRDSLREQAEVFKNLFQEARQEGRTIDDVQTLRFNEFCKNILAQNDSIFIGLADVRKEVQEVNAKVDIMASRLNDVRQNVEETKEALSHSFWNFKVRHRQIRIFFMPN
ncbi:hypothetical protein F511_41965 [Dorcoceras hygrometricum]|uniref:ICln family transporter: chloride ion current inducer protein I(Cln) n=1 Tax=Dorcoceras hygrometricum TaxID=472368 RepID=A0A2Z7D5B5_9LAMI|nr:hypothetical protein F511_41965 [Dorcoceras hygrometricum]